MFLFLNKFRCNCGLLMNNTIHCKKNCCEIKEILQNFINIKNAHSNDKKNSQQCFLQCSRTRPKHLGGMKQFCLNFCPNHDFVSFHGVAQIRDESCEDLFLLLSFYSFVFTCFLALNGTNKIGLVETNV